MTRRNGSGLKFRARIWEADEPDGYEVETSLGDVLAWERQASGEAFLAAGAPSLTRILWVLWRAARRAEKTTSKDPQGWAAALDDFELLDDEDEDEVDEADPTGPGL